MFVQLSKLDLLELLEFGGTFFFFFSKIVYFLTDVGKRLCLNQNDSGPGI